MHLATAQGGFAGTARAAATTELRVEATGFGQLQQGAGAGFPARFLAGGGKQHFHRFAGDRRLWRCRHADLSVAHQRGRPEGFRMNALVRDTQTAQAVVQRLGEGTGAAQVIVVVVQRQH